MKSRDFSIFIIYSDVLMLCRKFELIPIKIGFFTILKVVPKLGQSPSTIVQGLGPNFDKNYKERILHFYNFF